MAKKAAVSANKPEENQLIDVERKFDEFKKEIYNKLSELPAPKEESTSFKAAVIDEGIDRRQLFLMLLQATHQGAIANQYVGEVILNGRPEARLEEIRKIFEITMVSLREYERLTGNVVNES